MGKEGKNNDCLRSKIRVEVCVRGPLCSWKGLRKRRSPSVYCDDYSKLTFRWPPSSSAWERNFYLNTGFDYAGRTPFSPSDSLKISIVGTVTTRYLVCSCGRKKTCRSIYSFSVDIQTNIVTETQKTVNVNFNEDQLVNGNRNKSSVVYDYFEHGTRNTLGSVTCVSTYSVLMKEVSLESKSIPDFRQSVVVFISQGRKVKKRILHPDTLLCNLTDLLSTKSFTPDTINRGLTTKVVHEGSQQHNSKTTVDMDH